MNNQDLSKLPAVERLAEYRRQNPSPVWKTPTQKKAPASAIAGLNSNNPIDVLTAARLGYDLKPKAAAEPTAQAGFFDGSGFVILNDSIGIF